MGDLHDPGTPSGADRPLTPTSHPGPGQGGAGQGAEPGRDTEAGRGAEPGRDVEPARDSGPARDAEPGQPAGSRAGADGEAGSVHVMVSATRTRLVLSGEIDVTLEADLADAVADAERADQPVEVDARHVTFMDSSGVTVLARLAHRCPGRLALIQPPDVVRFLLEVTRIGEVVDVLDEDPGFPAVARPGGGLPPDAA
ncbi:STAS domain-containing protein [Georgenia sp. TF02-10]|uniref:STAS domain-containing protein n=1 Tax=Georgenia sp. TF02-10 TaxID=2917725 RepID=UPI001FA73EE3|nr:STAS domain-containing protein [Georgenia sp. TF02-10]UNX54598.1 STAS domain-containing protein [Georgenia sp. TF02-10]